MDQGINGLVLTTWRKATVVPNGGACCGGRPSTEATERRAHRVMKEEGVCRLGGAVPTLTACGVSIQLGGEFVKKITNCLIAGSFCSFQVSDGGGAT